MAERDIVVIGASAGGVEAVSSLIEALPRDFPAAVFVVVHFPPHVTSVLPRIISRRGGMLAEHAVDGAPIELGRVYVAPPDLHLIIETGHMRLVRGPRENMSRPAVDPLFRSAARAYGNRVMAVVLSGNLDDGSAGMIAVKKRGGLALVQDPDDALYSGMPASAIRNAPVDHVAPLAEIAQLLIQKAGETVETPEDDRSRALYETEVRVAEMDPDALETPRAGEPSAFACPECHGVLWEVQDGELTRFRCRVGHAYSMENLLAGQSAALDAALWTAYRALEERAALTARMADRMRDRSQPMLAVRYDEQTRETLERAEMIRRVLVTGSEDIPVVEGGPRESNVAD
ncbi:chemotaxis protein CheB [Longimicrobium terrae]|uniref:protein-glutamate methylesterase n=1 Tax=Longimicrobium terrae TaxID=1639882 RepID=A0A841H6A9_9BACT|nr:chemotaxis protein CheB [Longimicrobium terrae]MBB4638214.1 two-component system chemotaxis response regulator CheB [Longimicrobium terrae]MBB6073627.1 two-component system chemotaxis response regulator CheB [Longimicrobium terrae]NNC30307.1 chemotaxis protein CheB [Longimicrobium terrae]